MGIELNTMIFIGIIWNCVSVVWGFIIINKKHKTNLKTTIFVSKVVPLCILLCGTCILLLLFRYFNPI